MDHVSTFTSWFAFVSMASLSWTAIIVVFAALYLYLLIDASTTDKVDLVGSVTVLLGVLYLRVNLLGIPHGEHHGWSRANGRREWHRHLSQPDPRRGVGRVCGDYANTDPSICSIFNAEFDCSRTRDFSLVFVDMIFNLPGRPRAGAGRTGDSASMNASSPW